MKPACSLYDLGNEEAWAEKAESKADHKVAQRLDWTCKCQAQNHWECHNCFKCNTRRVKPPKAPKPPKPMVHKACLHACTSGSATKTATFTKTAEAAKYDAFGPNHGGAFRPFDCGRTA